MDFLFIYLYCKIEQKKNNTNGTDINEKSAIKDICPTKCLVAKDFKNNDNL